MWTPGKIIWTGNRYKIPPNNRSLYKLKDVSPQPTYLLTSTETVHRPSIIDEPLCVEKCPSTLWNWAHNRAGYRNIHLQITPMQLFVSRTSSYHIVVPQVKFRDMEFPWLTWNTNVFYSTTFEFSYSAGFIYVDITKLHLPNFFLPFFLSCI